MITAPVRHALMSEELWNIIANLTSDATGLPGWCTFAKAVHLAELVLCTRPHLCVELGVFGGRSFLPIALALRDVGHPALAVGIDPWDNKTAVEGMDPHDADDKKNIEYWSGVPMAQVHRRCAEAITAHGLWKTTAMVQARADSMARLFSPGSIDFLHIDGNHHTALAEVETWLPLCLPRATVVFDDANWVQTQPALNRLKDFATLLDDRGTYQVYRKL